MKISIIGFTIILNLLGSIAYSQTKSDKDCANVATQAERHRCLSKEYIYTNNQLTDIYNKILKRLDKDKRYDVAKALANTQKKWLIYRKDYGQVYEQLYKGGSIMPITVLECEIKTTQSRIVELTDLFEEVSK